MSALDVNHMKRNGLWTERIAEVNKKGFSTASSIARLIYSCETGNGIDQHAAEDLKYVSALIETQAAELLKLREEIKTLKELLYEAKEINTLVSSDGGNWSGRVKDDLEQRIDEVLSGFTGEYNG